jgi:hypothetical protein
MTTWTFECYNVRFQDICAALITSDSVLKIIRSTSGCGKICVFLMSRVKEQLEQLEVVSSKAAASLGSKEDGPITYVDFDKTWVLGYCN